MLCNQVRCLKITGRIILRNLAEPSLKILRMYLQQFIILIDFLCTQQHCYYIAFVPPEADSSTITILLNI